MKVCVCGLGYVGAVTAACLARLGHVVVGVDVASAKVDALNAGRSHFVEKGLGDLTAAMVAAGRLSATTDGVAAVRAADLTLICVGTPSREDGAFNSDFVVAVCRQVGEILRDLPSYHVVAIRSTLLPGLTRDLLIPQIARSSGKAPGRAFGVCVNPEFLREGSAIDDFFLPSRTVIGELDTASGDLLATLCDGIEAPIVRTSLETAEIAKYADNWWHALKVAFANELGTVSDAAGVDAQAVMSIFALDTRLNISARYLRPGAAFGGSCLPKDLRALTHLTHRLNLQLPLLESVLPSNRAHLDRALLAILASGARRIGFFGLTFKPGTDDIRESPAVELMRALLDKGLDVRVHDHNVVFADLVGANRAFLLDRIPDLASRLVGDADEMCRSVDAIVVLHDTDRYREVIDLHRARLPVIDCSRLRLRSEPVEERAPR